MQQPQHDQHQQALSQQQQQHLQQQIQQQQLQQHQLQQQQLQQQMVLCPVRVVYETQILVPPGEQYQPNQTIFINPQNPPPWANQNNQQMVQQNQMVYVQQVPQNIMTQVQPGMDQNQIQYIQQFQNMQPVQNQIVNQERQILRQPIQTIQFPNVPPDINAINMNQYAQMINAQNIQNMVQQQPQQIVQNVMNMPQMMQINTPPRPQMQQQVVHIPQNQVRNPAPVQNVRPPQQNQRPPQQNMIINSMQNVVQNIPNQVKPVNNTRPPFRHNLPQQIQPPRQNQPAQRSNYIPPQNQRQNNQIPNQNVPQNAFNQQKQKVPIPSNPQNQIRQRMPMQNQQIVRQQLPQIRPVQPQPQPQTMYRPRPNQIVRPNPPVRPDIRPEVRPEVRQEVRQEVRPQVDSRKRKSESPDEMKNKSVNTGTQVTFETKTYTLPSMPRLDIGVNTSPVHRPRIPNLSSVNTITISQVPVSNSNTVAPQIEVSKMEVESKDDQEKLIRNTVFAQARVRQQSQDKTEETTTQQPVQKVIEKPETVEVKKEITEQSKAVPAKIEPITPDLIQDVKQDDVTMAEPKVKEEETKPVDKMSAIDERLLKISEFNGKEIELSHGNKKNEKDNSYILTHVLDGIVIQESNVAFPVRIPLREKVLPNPPAVKEELAKKEVPPPAEEPKDTRTDSKIMTISKLNIDESKEGSVKQESKTEHPFAKLKPQSVKSWTSEQLESHLSTQSWCETASILREHEIDGEALFLVSNAQLTEIGINQNHADIMCEFVKS